MEKMPLGEAPRLTLKKVLDQGYSATQIPMLAYDDKTCATNAQHQLGNFQLPSEFKREKTLRLPFPETATRKKIFPLTSTMNTRFECIIM